MTPKIHENADCALICVSYMTAKLAETLAFSLGNGYHPECVALCCRSVASKQTYLGVIIPPVHEEHSVKLKWMAVHFNHHAISRLVARIKLLIKADKLPSMSRAV